MANKAVTRTLGIVPVLAVAVLAGCGGGSQHQAHVVTFTTAGAFPTATIEGVYSVRNCEQDTSVVVKNARLFYVHSTGGLGPADLYFYDLRFAYAHFQADGCSPGELGESLATRLTPRQRSWLLDNLSGTLTAAFRAALDAR